MGCRLLGRMLPPMKRPTSRQRRRRGSAFIKILMIMRWLTPQPRGLPNKMVIWVTHLSLISLTRIPMTSSRMILTRTMRLTRLFSLTERLLMFLIRLNQKMLRRRRRPQPRPLRRRSSMLRTPGLSRTSMTGPSRNSLNHPSPNPRSMPRDKSFRK